jgi:putative spermidine/putrescine transport system permease protein
MRRSVLLAPALALVGGLLLTSVAVAAAQSLGALALTGDGRIGWSAYGSLVRDQEALASLAVGISVATVATVLACLVGLAVVAAVRATYVGGRALALMAAVTVPVPHLVGAVGIGLLLSDSGLLARIAAAPPGAWPQLVGGPWWSAVVLELAWKESAFVALVVLASLPRHLQELDDTAAVLGASPWQRFRGVTLELAAPALLLAATVSFVYALGSYEVAWLLGPVQPETLPVLAYRLFGSSDLGVRPEAMAASVLLVVVCAVTTIVAAAPLRRRWTLL